MFSPEVQAQIPEFKARKWAQWRRIEAINADPATALTGLQLAQSGDHGTSFMITCSTHDDAFYESVILGQLSQVVQEAYGNQRRPRYRAVPEDKKPLEKRGFDLTDAQIDEVLALWAKRQSAFALPFITAVWGPGNKLHVKQ